MEAKNKYKTKNHEKMLDYLESVPGKHITVNDVSSFFDAKGEHMGTTTIYRQLESLVGEGLVNKYTIEPGTPACFEYVGKSSHCSEENCFHCKCEKCGRLIHMQCDELNMLSSHLLNEHGFMLDGMRTVFYGLCEFCREPEKK